MNKVIKLVRTNDTYDDRTFGKLYIDGEFICDTLEPAEGYFYSYSDPLLIAKAKEFRTICIPYGCYPITLEVQSPSLKKRPVYKCINWLIPRLLNIPKFNGVLIHIGNYPKDTKGCILVGRYINYPQPMLTDSTKTFFKLYDILKAYQPTHIEITADYDFAR